MKTPTMNIVALSVAAVLSSTPAAGWAQAQASSPATAPAAAPASSGPTFQIRRFNVQGNTLIPQAQVDALLAQYLGAGRSFADVQMALEALEEAYRAKGFSAVGVVLPEQDITAGEVRFNVIEGRFANIAVKGNKHFSEANVRASLPMLQSGGMPNSVRLAGQTRLANENPAKKASVLMRLGNNPGDVDVDITVEDERPVRYFANVDNTGNGGNAGTYRLTAGVQHANLTNSDDVLTVQYGLAPERPGQLSVLSASYRRPLYAAGRTLDLYATHSNVKGGTSITTAGPLTFAGAGTVFGVRLGQMLPRDGTLDHSMSVSLDHKAYDNTCSLGEFGPAGCGAAANDVTVRPVSAEYAGQVARPESQTQFSLGVALNIPGGSKGGDADFAAVRPNAAGTGGAKAGFKVLRGSVAHTELFKSGWQLRVNAVAQFTPDALVAGEQIGLAGSNAVRGFKERAVARDRGAFVQLEAYTPELAGLIKLPEGATLRVVGFVDAASGANVVMEGDKSLSQTVASVGVGLRAALGKNTLIKLDVGRPFKSPVEIAERWRGHLLLTTRF